MSFAQRLINIFVAPSKVFMELLQRPTWVAPLVALTLFAVLLNAGVLYTKAGEEALALQIRENPRAANMPAEAMPRAIAFGKAVGVVAALFAPTVIALIGSLLVYLLFSIGLGGEASYKQTFSAWSHAGLIGLLGGLVQTGLFLVKRRFQVYTSFSSLLPFLEEKSFLYKLGQGLDLFWIWHFAVMSIGRGIRNRVTTRKAAVGILAAYFGINLLIALIRWATG